MMKWEMVKKNYISNGEITYIIISKLGSEIYVGKVLNYWI